ncbi:hypothetical protein CMUS01_15924 [Colletotrichum musicola]|uniref:Uncharacterized protein n=1 Tax=Colletotrichum musicola TaxID=2175873 RepID=A0A8H6ML53_9PEZI|nr:hypothetical protein CMUS01_15924 [Colletotrichum musicola]
MLPLKDEAQTITVKPSKTMVVKIVGIRVRYLHRWIRVSLLGNTVASRPRASAIQDGAPAPRSAVIVSTEDPLFGRTHSWASVVYDVNGFSSAAIATTFPSTGIHARGLGMGASRKSYWTELTCRWLDSIKNRRTNR